MKYYVVNAFTDKSLAGSPAGVCFVEHGLDEHTMRGIAADNKLMETAFVTRNGDSFDLRWFTPEAELDLCGHATLAAAFAVFSFIDKSKRKISFNTRSGELRVAVKKNIKDLSNLYEMDFPAWELEPVEPTEQMRLAVGGADVLEAYAARDLILLLASEDAVAKVAPDFDALRGLEDYFGVAVTARGRKADFVSRFFAPNAGIPEAQVTGSAHCGLIPFWAGRLDKNIMTALQVSERGGAVFCEHRGDRVRIGGKARLSREG